MKWELRVMYRLVPVASLLLAACTGLPEGVVPVGSFDAQRYEGKWYEIARLDHPFERGLTNVSATYSIRADGSLNVVNTGYDRESCRWKEADGRATFLKDKQTASLAVTFVWPFAGGYHVFNLDQTDYRWAVVAGPTRDYLWILARQPHISDKTRKRLVAEAQRLGFPVNELIFVDHSAPVCEQRQPALK